MSLATIKNSFKGNKNFILGGAIILVLLVAFVCFLKKFDKEYILLFLTGCGWICGQIYLKRKEISQKHFEKKVDVYQKFASGFVGLGLVDEAERTRRITENLPEFQKAVLIWGNAQMIKDYLTFQKMLAMGATNQLSPLVITDFMLKMIRKDLGHNDISLNEYDLARFVINDVDKVLGEKNDSSQ